MNELALISADALSFRISFLETLITKGLIETESAEQLIHELKQELTRRSNGGSNA